MIIKIAELEGKAYWECRSCRARWVSGGNPEFEHCCHYLDVGPGTELERMISPLGIPSCTACVELKYKMNEWGASICRQRLPQIVENIVTRTSLPLARLVVARMVERAIARDEDRLKKLIQELETSR